MILLVTMLVCMFLFLASTNMLILFIISILNTWIVILGLDMMILNSSCFLWTSSDLLLTSNTIVNSSRWLKLLPWLRSRFFGSYTSLDLILLIKDKLRISLILIWKLIESLITSMNSWINNLCRSNCWILISNFINIFLNCIWNFILPLFFWLKIYFLVIIILRLFLLLMVNCVFLLNNII